MLYDNKARFLYRSGLYYICSTLASKRKQVNSYIPVPLLQPELEIITERKIKAAPELVYKAWANPKHLKNWWGPKGFTNTFHEHELRPGGQWNFVMHGPEGGNYTNECVFLNVEEHRLLHWDHLSAPRFQVVATFDPASEPDHTHVRFRMIFDTCEECEQIRKFAPQKNEENFDRLEAELERMKLR